MFTNKALRKLIGPLFMDQIFIIAVSLVATMMLTHAGEAAASAISLVDMINMLLMNVIIALATGGAVVVSQYIGRGEKENACTAASQLFTVNIAISACLALLVVLLNRPLLQLLYGSVTDDTMAASITYFAISGLSYPFFAMYNAGAALFRSMGNGRIPMTASIAMNLLSVLGSAIGIFLLNAGVMGVAISTLVARAAAAAALTYLSQKRIYDVHIKSSDVFSWHGQMIRRILNVGVPNGVENGIFQLGRVLITSMISLFGTTQIVSTGVANSFMGLAVSFPGAINLAIVTVVGQCLGAGDYEQAARYTKRLVKTAYIGTACVCLAELLLLPLALNLYALSAEAKQLTFTLVAIHNGFAALLWPVSFTLSFSLRASGDVRFTMLVSIASMFIMRITCAYFLGIVFQMGVIGIWIAMGLDWATRSAFFIIRFRSGKWKNFKVI